MGLLVGSLSGQNWHRQMRRLNLDHTRRLDYMIDKTAAVGKEFGFSPMGIDLSVTALPSFDRSYVEEFKARLSENDLTPVMGVGGVVLSYDEEVRLGALNTGYQHLEVVAQLGGHTAGFGCGMNGRVTREGRIRLAIDSVGRLGRAARDHDIRICQEDWDYFSSDDLIRICEGTGLENVGIQSDTGNWYILGEDPLFATKKCLPLTFHTHVRDYAIEGGTYNGVALGRGIVDFPNILPLFAQRAENDRLVLSMEVDTDDRDEDEAASASFQYLKDWLIATGHWPEVSSGNKT
jgi:sugar phosphate isomerase/epimerase